MKNQQKHHHPTELPPSVASVALLGPGRDVANKSTSSATGAEISTGPPPVFVLFRELPNYGVPRYSRVHLYRLMRQGQFPLPVQLSPNRVAWRLHSILEWCANRPPSARVHVEVADATD